MTAPEITNAFTVDVEDYYHVSAFADRIRPADWDSFESRVVSTTHRLLEILASHEIRATFFVLGWIADRFPQLVAEIHRAGHETGCHSYWHRLIYEMTPDEFRTDLCRARNALENITGTAVTAYRAPSFSIVDQSLWALDILAEEGFRYDSSIYPIYHDRYGIPGAPTVPHQIRTPSGPLWEFPASVSRRWRFNLPVGGGGWFRLYPLQITLRGLRTINRAGQPFMFYVHPWELDPAQPRLAGSFRSRFRHYLNLRHTEPRLRTVCRQFRFAPLSEVLAGRESVPARCQHVG